jgi:hypothetical protein
VPATTLPSVTPTAPPAPPPLYLPYALDP